MSSLLLCFGMQSLRGFAFSSHFVTSRNQRLCIAIFCLLHSWFCFIIMWCVTSVSACLRTRARRQKIVVALVCASFFVFFHDWERCMWPQSLCLTILFFFLLNTTVLLHRFSLTLSFCAFQLFICLHPAFASDTVGTELWARKKKPTETFAFFLFTRSTSALLGDGSQSFVSLSRCLTKLTLHFASCGHEQHCRNTAVWGNGQVLKRRSCCVCG